MYSQNKQRHAHSLIIKIQSFSSLISSSDNYAFSTFFLKVEVLTAVLAPAYSNNNNKKSYNVLEFLYLAT